MFLKLIVTLLSLSNYKLVISKSDVRNGVRILSSADYTDDPLVTNLSEGDTITGSILNKKYRYYKYTFSYADDFKSHSINDSADRNAIREKAIVEGSVNNVPTSGINDISISSISSGTATNNHARDTGRSTTFNPIGNKLFENTNSIKVIDPYDPSDPLKNSIQIDLEPISGDTGIHTYKQTCESIWIIQLRTLFSCIYIYIYMYIYIYIYTYIYKH
jgi:hypothetical protein